MHCLYKNLEDNFCALHVRKSETAINQTPISSVGRKDPLPFCVQ
nr:MAG TPA: hypothetical protein [Caudoviricetes sp.]